MEADGICLRRRQKNRAAEKRQPLILQIFIERLTRRTINDRAIVIADLLASLLELLKLPAGINMLILELPGDDLILIDDTRFITVIFRCMSCISLCWSSSGAFT